MIRFEHTEVWGWEHAIRGMRNPLNSWDKIDSTDENLGINDKKLMTRLIEGGEPHRKFLRQIMVSVDITAPLYWWKQMDTYKVGTTANSCSTMHRIAAKEFTWDDFSHEHIQLNFYHNCMENIIYCLNCARNSYLETHSKADWWQMIQLLPESYNQKRTVTMNYENLLNILKYRQGHKLDEWRDFCEWITTLPNSDILFEGLKS